MGNTRRAFKPEFKREVVRQAMQPGNTIAAFSREIGLHESVLRRWIKEIGLNSEQALQLLPGCDTQVRELSGLRNQVAQRRMAREAIVHALSRFATSDRSSSS